MAKKQQLSSEELERRLYRYLSTHYRPMTGEEAYDFDIKIHQRIEIPDIVKAAKGLSEAELSTTVEEFMEQRLKAFAHDLKERFGWISKWYQEGRTGGWLVLVTEEPVLDESGHFEVPGGEFPGERARAIKAARKRLEDLDTISALVDGGIGKFIDDLEDPKFWGIGPKDWMPSEKR